MDSDAKRGRVLLEESREAVIVLDDDDVVVVAGRRARQSIPDPGGRADPRGPSVRGRGVVPLIVPYEIDGRRERLVYLSQGAT